MKRKYSIAHLSALQVPPQDMVYMAAAAGYDYVSIRPVILGTPGEPNYAVEKNPEMYKEFDEAMRATGMKLSDIELFRLTDEVDIDAWKPAFEFAQAHDCHQLITSCWTQKKEYAKETLAKLCETIKPYGITANFEFVTWSACPTLKEAKEYITSTGADNIGLLVDTLHFDRSRVTLAELDECPRDWFNFVHLCDGPAPRPAMDDNEALIHTGRDARYYVGEGCVDIAGIVSHIPDTATLSIELPHIKRVEAYGALEHYKQCLNTAKAYLKLHGLDE
ncbi:MAG: sugar phosphate isomerase/epimerase [Lachnospiraceae bacterium]|nr:sugar phosphate isomerase/epimerase [Lachnospiraceae bacterium]